MIGTIFFTSNYSQYCPASLFIINFTLAIVCTIIYGKFKYSAQRFDDHFHFPIHFPVGKCRVDVRTGKWLFSVKTYTQRQRYLVAICADLCLLYYLWCQQWGQTKCRV